MAVQDLIAAANGGVPNNKYKPQNCHEAVFGWMLQAKYPQLRAADAMAQGAPKAWFTLRNIALRYGGNAPKQLTGQWVGQHLYGVGGQRIMRVGPAVAPFPPNTVALGDIIYMGNPVNPHHSVVVVQVNGPQAMVRGFNNAGAFGGPFMAWDQNTHDILDITRWTPASEFMCVNGPAAVSRISYAQYAAIIPDNMNF